MKIIDLLNRIAKDEEIPIKIKFKGEEYEWSKEYYDYSCIDTNCRFLVEELETEDLSRTCEEIPIIEDKKIEKLEEKYYHDEPALIDDMAHKINEIIDYINKEE